MQSMEISNAKLSMFFSPKQMVDQLTKYGFSQAPLRPKGNPFISTQVLNSTSLKWQKET